MWVRAVRYARFPSMAWKAHGTPLQVSFNVHVCFITFNARNEADLPLTPNIYRYTVNSGHLKPISDYTPFSTPLSVGAMHVSNISMNPRTPRTQTLRRPTTKKDTAIYVVSKLLADKTYVPLVLVSAVDYQRSHGKFRSDFYTHFGFVFHVNTRSSAGWVVFHRLYGGDCGICSAFRSYSPGNGTRNLDNHLSMHDAYMRSTSGTASLVTISPAHKKKITEGVVHAVCEGLLPLVLAEGKYGIVSFVCSLLQAGQFLPVIHTF